MLSKQQQNILGIMNLLTALGYDEILYAQRYWLRQTQMEAFPEMEKKRRFIYFTPILDFKGLLSVDGQLSLAEDLPYQTRHPIILATHCAIIRLIVENAHKKPGHNTGTEHVLTYFRAKY